MSLGNKIKRFALTQFGSISDFARVMGMSPSNINFYITGRRKPGADILNKMRELGCDINWLLSEEEEGVIPVVGEPEIKYGDEEEEIREKIDEIKETIREIEKILDRGKRRKKRY